jgi:hypothetical protein
MIKTGKQIFYAFIEKPAGMLVFCLFIASCSHEIFPPANAPDNDAMKIKLRWIKAYEQDDWQKAQAGLWWALSSLGALPPEKDNGLKTITTKPERVVFELNLHKIGLPESALVPLAEAIQPIVASDEMALYGSVDLGRFFMKTLYEPWHYYNITGVAENLDEFMASKLKSPLATYAVTVSWVTVNNRHRLVKFNPNPANLQTMAFLAQEGTGSLLDGTFMPAGVEVIDFMPNGQQRFAIYGANGQLEFSANPEHTRAGQPGKCMWCHEGTLQFGDPRNTKVDTALSFDAFREQIVFAQQTLAAEREKLRTSVDFQTYQVHTWAELLVETFLKPSLARVAREWETSEDEVKSIVAAQNLSVHQPEEYLEVIGTAPLLRRAEVDAVHEMLVPTLTTRPNSSIFGKDATGYTNLRTLNSSREWPDTESPGGK